MSTEDPFISLAELAATEVPISKLVTAIEMIGFFAWDRFGRYTQVKPTDVGGENDRLGNSVLDALAKGYKGDEVDIDYFENMRFGPSVLTLSGWAESAIPDFDQLQKEWYQQHIGELVVPTKPTSIPTFIEPKRKDDWYNCIQDAVTIFHNEHGSFPTEPQLWAYLHSGKLALWSLDKKDGSLILSDSVLDRENFKKRFNRYFHYSANND